MIPDSERMVAKTGTTLRILGTAAVLAALWLLMSGLYKPLILALGAASVVLVVYIIHRMDTVDGDRVELHLKPVAFVRYFFWLLVEIAKANWEVTRVILSPKMPVRQHLYSVPYTQKSDLAQVIYASSITLTPGTLTVETDVGFFLVHGLAYAPEDMDALADMDARVSAVERSSAD